MLRDENVSLFPTLPSLLSCRQTLNGMALTKVSLVENVLREVSTHPLSSSDPLYLCNQVRIADVIGLKRYLNSSYASKQTRPLVSKLHHAPQLVLFLRGNFLHYLLWIVLFNIRTCKKSPEV